MGVWIETSFGVDTINYVGVTPCVGVWIETYIVKTAPLLIRGHTLRGCVD